MTYETKTEMQTDYKTLDATVEYQPNQRRFALVVDGTPIPNDWSKGLTFDGFLSPFMAMEAAGELGITIMCGFCHVKMAEHDMDTHLALSQSTCACGGTADVDYHGRLACGPKGRA